MHFSRTLQTRLFALGCVLLATQVVFCQTVASIEGETRDSSGAIVTGVNVTATNTGTNAARSVATNDAGVYSFPSLAPGTYTLRAEKAGFKAVVRSQIELQVQQAARIDIELQIGQVNESIEVRGDTALLATDNATVGTVIENKRIVELPLNGRNYLQLVSLAPNVSTGFSGQGQAVSRQGGIRASQTISVAGQRANFNHYTLDGVENTDPNFNTFIILPSIDALQEFKVQTGVYPAEFGRHTTQINVLTKSGTNQYHGTLFEFLRNDKLDANNYSFTSARPAKDPFKWNQYGFTLGGPIWLPKIFNGKDKLFFMANYESFRKRGTVQQPFTLASAAMQGGDFSGIANRLYDPTTRVRQADGTITASLFAGNILPQNRISPISKKFLQFYHTPNLPGVTNNFIEPLARPQNRDQFILRMDYLESPRSTWAGRYSWGDENESSPGLNLNGSKLLVNTEQYMGSNTRVLSPTVVTEIRFGYTRNYNVIGTLLGFQRNVVDELGIPGLKSGPPKQWGIPNIGITNYQGIGDDTNGPFENNNNTLQFLSNTSVIRGNHTFRFGGEIRRDQFNQVGTELARAAFSFDLKATQDPLTRTQGNAFAEFLLGNVTLSQAAVSLAEAQFRSTGFSLYLDDVWKVTPKLTLSLGLRYENTPPWEDQTGRLTTVFIPYFDNTAQVADKSRYPVFLRQGKGDPYEGATLRWPDITVVRDGRLPNALVYRDNNDFAPRIGIAYSPNSKWSFRVGAGAFYNQDQGNPRFDVARNLSGRTRTDDNPDFPFQTFDNALASLAGTIANVFTPQAFSNKFDRRTPYSLQWLFNVQRELAGNLTLEAGFLGSASRKLESWRPVNEPLPGTSGTLASRSPYPNFSRIPLVDNGGRGNYNSLATKLTKRYSSGMTALMAYTWSKSIDETSGIRTSDSDTLFPQTGYCMRCERGLSAFDNRQRLVVSGLYDLPIGKGRKMDIRSRFLDAAVGGWQLGSIVTWRSGFPTSPMAGTDRSNTGGIDRPNATGISQQLDNPTTQQWFNTAAFALQPSGVFGSAGRNTIIGPNGFSWDFSTHKDFRMPKEGHELEFRMEAFNLLNHPVWGLPNKAVNNPATFGTITSTSASMRQMQFALKYVF